MSLELENRVAKLERDARVTRELLDATIVEIKAVHARLVAIETRMNAPPVTIDVRPGGFVTRRDVYGDAKPSLAPPAVAWTPSPDSVAVFPGGLVPAHDVSDEVRASLRACNVDHDTCSAEQRSGTGRAAQGTCVRGVVDLVAASADDQHAAERGTPAAGAEVTASEGGDTARDDSVVAELREVVGMLVKADRLEREAERADPLDGAWRADLGYAAKSLRRDAEKRVASCRERAVASERRKWAMAIASALDGADRSGCESSVSREEMAARVAAMRAELERERKLRRESEEAFKALSKAATDPRNEEARRRGLATGARVRLEGGQAHLGTVCGFDTDGDPIVVVPHGIERYYAFDLVTDTEATT